ncbi:MAG TPA: histidine kinase dimerization/phospho-acceptor domain-containing protein, partial [Myxococcaceae bacterium]|nr:histidine kinase dimerization/phospho-acceptor domain-containing protein [Myxococcaceae bacterium]
MGHLRPMNRRRKYEISMDVEWVEWVRIDWSPTLQVTVVQGACERVLGRSADALHGMALHQALGILPLQAVDLDLRARRARSGQTVEFLRAALPGREGTLRLRVGMRDNTASATAADFTALLKGAPPVQISGLSSSLSHEIRNPLSSVKMAVQTLARNTQLSARDQRRLAIANREIRTVERMLWLLSEYGRDGA